MSSNDIPRPSNPVADTAPDLVKSESSVKRALFNLPVKHEELKEETESPMASSPVGSEEHKLPQEDDELDEDGEFVVNYYKPAPVRVLTTGAMSGSRLYLTPHASEASRPIQDELPPTDEEGAAMPTGPPADAVAKVSSDGGGTVSKHKKAPSLAEQKIMKEENQKKKKSTGPPDGGYGWVIVGCAFFVLFAVLGTMYCFGLIYVYLLSDFGSTKATTALVGSVNLASFLFFGAPTGRLIQVIGPKRVTQLGGCIAGTFLVLSGSTTSLWQLFLVFGVLAGMGFSLSYGPALIILSTYFDKRRPLAVGIAVAGSGVGTLVMAQVVSAILTNLGWRNAFRIIGAIAFCIIVTAGSLYKELPKTGATAYTSSRAVTEKQSTVKELCQLDKIIDFKFLKANRYVQCLSATMFISAFGYYAPQIHLVKYATEVGISSTNASYLVSIMGVGSTFGRIIFGKLSAGSPRKRVNLFIFSTFATGFFACMLPLLAKAGFGGFVVFVICYGSVAGAFIAMMPVVTADLVGLAKLPRSLGLQFSAQVATVLSGPSLVGLVADSTGSYAYAFLLAGAVLITSTIPLLIIPRLVAAQPKKNRIKTLRTAAS
jgi:MCP family monocarboxylic acid transporter-like MFS transporter 12